MGYWLWSHEGERNNCVSKIQLVGQKYRDKTTLVSKTRFSRHRLLNIVHRHVRKNMNQTNDSKRAKAFLSDARQQE